MNTTGSVREKATKKEGGMVTDSGDESSMGSGMDVLWMQDLDPALSQKMHLVNNAIDEIGWTTYHWKLFFLNGFGYAVDSLILLLQSIVYPSAYREFGSEGFYRGLTIAVYVGMLLGALFWGVTADIMGRKYAFNVSLFICSLSAMLAGATPNWGSLGFFVALLGFGGGGNLILDTTVFLEYLPGNKQWLVTFLACWWGLGQAIAGFIAWGFMVPEMWNCPGDGPCSRANNMGWRYVMFTSGALVFVMSIARVTVVRLRETPKYLLGMGEDTKVIETLQHLATKYDRPCSLTAETLEACGMVRTAHSASLFSVAEFLTHIRGLFASGQLALSTCLIWLSWLLIGLAYPLFYVFLYSYLDNNGTQLDVSSYTTWRDYALTNVVSIFGPMLAGYLCELRPLGRRGTMVIGGLMSCAFFFAFTAVRTEIQNVGISCAIGFAVNVYYGTLYAYTPEVLPSAHRATGNGIAVAMNRLSGIISAIIATYADVSTKAPIFVCAALFVVMSVLSMCFPFEPFGRRSS